MFNRECLLRQAAACVARATFSSMLALTLAGPAFADEPAPAEPASQAQPPAGAGGMGDVNIFPRRIVMSGSRRVASIGLLNRSQATGEYDIDVSELVMGPDGRLSAPEVAEDQAVVAGLKPASPFLIWSPHHVVLRGGHSQVIRVMAHIPADQPAGEYRSHLFVVANTPEPPDADGANAPEKAFTTAITPRFGISLPVILRVGETTLAAGISALAIGQSDGISTITLTITRSGSRSAFGDLFVYAPGRKAPVAQVLGLGIYPEINHRVVRLNVDPTVPPAMLASGAKLTAVYLDDDMNPGKELARREFVVP